MSGNWSLEGKRIDEPDCEQCSTGNIYAEKTMETLHQKLIEDINELRDNAPSEYNQGLQDCIDIINGRFGVKL